MATLSTALTKGRDHSPENALIWMRGEGVEVYGSAVVALWAVALDGNGTGKGRWKLAGNKQVRSNGPTTQQ